VKATVTDAGRTRHGCRPEGSPGTDRREKARVDVSRRVALPRRGGGSHIAPSHRRACRHIWSGIPARRAGEPGMDRGPIGAIGSGADFPLIRPSGGRYRVVATGRPGPAPERAHGALARPPEAITRQARRGQLRTRGPITPSRRGCGDRNAGASG
jgi:hypothetical protein